MAQGIDLARIWGAEEIAPRKGVLLVKCLYFCTIDMSVTH